MEIKLLGGISVIDDDGAQIEVGPPMCQTALAALALSAGSPVPVPRLVELLWGVDAPPTAEKTLQSHITRLRKSLGAEVISRVGAAYRLELEHTSVDVLRFQHLVEAGNMRAALREWTGTPFSGLDAEGLAGTSSALTEQWLIAVEADLTTVAATDPQAAIGPLTELTTAHPLREGLWALQMSALYAVGRQADALVAYRTARAHLVGDLGIEPGPQLRQLEQQILDQSAELHTRDPNRSPNLGNLVRPPGRLIGRNDSLAAIASELGSSTIVTLVGPGGIGKTRLALEAAHQQTPIYPSTWFIGLADVPTNNDVPRAVATELDVTDTPARSTTESIAAALRTRKALVVLDNCEHVIDGAAHLARAITENCPDVRILATSREGLAIAGERLVIVGSLDLSGAAVELFHERATALDRDYRPQAHDADVTEICRRLDGIPLAIELAAACTRSLTPTDLLDRLDDTFRLLTRGRRGGVERHRTLRATIQWSYDLLTPPQQSLLGLLSVFAGSFDLEAAEAVVADTQVDPSDVIGLVSDLVDRSMVMVDKGPFGHRFRLLEVIRQFAAEVVDSDTIDQLAQRHAEHTARTLRELRPILGGNNETEGVTRLFELWPNIRAAIDWATTTEDLALTTSLIEPIAIQAYLRRGVGEIADWAERLLAMADTDDDATIALGLLWTAFRHVMTHDRAAYARIEERYGQPDHILARVAHVAVADNDEGILAVAPAASAELRRRGDEQAASLLEIFVGGVLMSQGRLDEAEAYLEQLADHFRTTGPPTFLNWTLFMLASSADFRGDRARAEALYDESLTMPLPPRTNSPNEILEARAAFQRGDHIQAFTILRDFVDELLEARNMSPAGLISLEFVNMMTATTRLTQAARILGYLDATGMLDVEGPGFRQLVTHASRQIDADAEAATTRRSTAAEEVDDEWALHTILDTLDDLLDRDSTTPPPTND